MPLFARRDIQDRIYALGDCLPADQIAAIIERLNNHQRDRMAALWEVVMLQAFSTLGTLTSEAELEDGKRPDILLRPTDSTLPVICADITAVSDAGSLRANPWSACSRAPLVLNWRKTNRSRSEPNFSAASCRPTHRLSTWASVKNIVLRYAAATPRSSLAKHRNRGGSSHGHGHGHG